MIAVAPGIRSVCRRRGRGCRRVRGGVVGWSRGARGRRSWRGCGCRWGEMPCAVGVRRRGRSPDLRDYFVAGFVVAADLHAALFDDGAQRSEEYTSELTPLMRIPYAG